MFCVCRYILNAFIIEFQVIYALNTKNDEHEAIVQSLKDQHEEEMQQLLMETKEKIAVYKAKLDSESIHSKKIEVLESTISEHQRHKQTALQQFESFKLQAEERETKLKSEHAQKMLELSHEVLKAKKTFEDKLKDFELWKDSVSSEKDKEIEKLKEKYEKEIDEVRNHQRSQNDEWLNDVKNIEEKYKSELGQLQEKYDNLEIEKNKAAEDYEGKLHKAQLFYEKELEALKTLSSSSNEEAQRLLREEQERLRKDYALQESELRKQISSLTNQVIEKEDELEKCKSDLQRLQASLSDKDSSSSELNKQVSIHETFVQVKMNIKK